MLRRSVFEISRRRCIGRVEGKVKTQIPTYLSSRKEFSTASQPPKGPIGKPSESKSNLPKVIFVNVVVGAAALAAYQAGYMDQFLDKKQHSSFESSKIGENHKEKSKDEHKEEPVVFPNVDESNKLSPDAEHTSENLSMQSDVMHIEAESEGEHNAPIQVEDKSILALGEAPIPIEEKKFPEHLQNDVNSEEQTIDSETLAEGTLGMINPDTTTSEMNEGVHTSPISSHDSAVPEAYVIKAGVPQHVIIVKDIAEDAIGKDVESPSPLIDAYDLRDKDDATSSGQGTIDYKHPREEVLIGTGDAQGKLVLDFLEAIHTAEKRQAELDAHVFGEEKRMLKEKYEKELKDARARQLMYAEEAAILDKELNKERTKAAVAIKSLQEKAEEKLRMELEQKEKEAELKRKIIQELAKAELAAVIASEKASQIEKMADANLNINALCMAFNARSEEARQAHSIHKLALGALAIEDTLSRGLAVKKEIEALLTYLEGIDKDPLIDLVLSSLPDEARHSGTDTVLQLNQKFDALKGTLRHFSLIPPGGGGILAHSLARIASALKVKESGQSGDGIESVINRVESYLAEGKIAEAADILEEGVKGSQAAEVVGDWVKRARNRAISEQALTLLQSYATSISLT